MRRGRPGALRVLRRARDSGAPRRQADRRRRRGRAAAPRRARASRPGERGPRPAPDRRATRSGRSSRTPAALAALHSPRPGSSISPASPPPTPRCRGRRRNRRHGLPGSGLSAPRREHRGRARARPHRGGLVVSCAGAWSDRLAVAAGAPAEPRIVPFRGGYLRLRPERRDLVRASIYPVPDPDLPFLGGHLTRTIDGEVLLGPSALMVGARDAYRLGAGAGPRSRDRISLARDMAADGPLLAHRHGRDPPRGQQARLRLGAAPLRPGARRRRRAARARRGSAPRRSTATAGWSTTSSCTGPSAPCTSATPPRPRRPRPSHSRN